MTILAIEDFYNAADDGPTYHFAMQRAQAVLPSTGGVIEFTRQPLYTFTEKVPLTRRVWLRGIESAQTTESTTQLRFVSCAGFHIVYPGNPDYPDAQNGLVGLSHMMIFRQGGPTQAFDHHGVQVDRTTWMEHVSIFAFPGYGVINDTDVTREPKTGANLCLFTNVRVYNAGRSGWLFRGGDANKCTLLHCWADICGMRRLPGDNHGFYEDSLIGNLYVGCHSDLGASNPGGRTYYAVKPSNASSFVGCYSEGPHVEITGSCRVDGGPMAAAPGVRLNGILHGNPQIITDYMQRTLGPQGVQSRYARYGTDEVWHIWSTKDPVGLKLIYSDFHKGWLTLHSGATLLSGWGVTGAEHPRGKGLTFAPRGVLAGTVRHGGGTTPPAMQPAAPDAAWKVGDIFWNGAASSPERWRCTDVTPEGVIEWEPKD